MDNSIWIGFDPREAAAFAVARRSATRFLTQRIPVCGLVLDELKESGLYRRPTEHRAAAADRPIMWDVISDAPMSTEHANARFLVPAIALSGWALFMDGDVLVRSNLARLFHSLDPAKALYCVKHNYAPQNTVKMDGQTQTAYSRKNWSSFMVFNVDHPANRKLTPELVNTVPGRDLHRFCWLEDDQIGELGVEWNWLVRHSPKIDSPKVVHFTEGCPDMRGYEKDPYADEWRAELTAWAA